MSGDEILRVVSAALKIILAVFLFAGIAAAFAAQLGERRQALREFRKLRLVGEGEVFFVRHASEANLADRSKPFAGDGFGALTVTPRAVVYRAGAGADAQRSVEFVPGRAAAEWVGRRWKSGAFSWFAIAGGGERHYFTSAARVNVLGARRRTRRMYDAVAARLGERIPATSPIVEGG
ncbi:MAG TPA: hypothetical protein VF771_13025 [Longimicrobiaceae bacterium]